MSSCTTTPFSHTRGATFQMMARIPSRFLDGHFSGWLPTSKVVTEDDMAVATLDVAWENPATTRVLVMRCLNTDSWPIGLARFDVRLTGPDGFVLMTTAVPFYVLKGATSA